MQKFKLTDIACTNTQPAKAGNYSVIDDTIAEQENYKSEAHYDVIDNEYGGGEERSTATSLIIFIAIASMMVGIGGALTFKPPQNKFDVEIVKATNYRALLEKQSIETASGIVSAENSLNALQEKMNNIASNIETSDKNIKALIEQKIAR